MFRAPESQTTVSLLTTCVEGCWIQARCRDPSVCQSNRGAHARVSESERVNERESERERESHFGSSAAPFVWGLVLPSFIGGEEPEGWPGL